MELREVFSYILAIIISYFVIGELYNLIITGIVLVNPGNISYFLDISFTPVAYILGIVVIIVQIYAGIKCYRDKNIFYEIFKLNKKNSLLSFVISLIFLSILLISSTGFQGDIFVNPYTLGPIGNIIGIPLSIISFTIVFYPFSALCYFVYENRKTIFNFSKRKTKISPRIKVLIIVLLILLNPFFVTISTAFSTLLRYNALYETCGVKYLGFTTDSAARDAGMKLDEIIVKIDGNDIKEGQDLSTILNVNYNKTVTILTDKGNIYNVTLRFDKSFGKYMLGIANVSNAFCEKRV